MTVAEAEKAGTAQPAPVFRFDRRALLTRIAKAGEVPVLVPNLDDADRLDQILADAERAGILSHAQKGVGLHIYPRSLVEPTPHVVVKLQHGPALFGPEVNLQRRAKEDPLSYTGRLFEQIVHVANGLVSERDKDSQQLDRLADFINRPGPVKGCDFLKFAEKTLAESGRAMPTAPAVSSVEPCRPGERQRTP